MSAPKKVEMQEKLTINSQSTFSFCSWILEGQFKIDLATEMLTVKNVYEDKIL